MTQPAPRRYAGGRSPGRIAHPPTEGTTRGGLQIACVQDGQVEFACRALGFDRQETRPSFLSQPLSPTGVMAFYRLSRATFITHFPDGFMQVWIGDVRGAIIDCNHPLYAQIMCEIPEHVTFLPRPSRQGFDPEGYLTKEEDASLRCALDGYLSEDTYR